jgi:hypothetical protein
MKLWLHRSLQATRYSILLCATIFAFLLMPSSSCAADNLLQNGDFSAGSGDQPDVWRTEAWINKPESFETHWTTAAAPNVSELEVNNIEANDGRWMQSLTLKEGWYELSAEVRTENVGAKETGASVSVLEDGVMSADLHGTVGWQRLSLYLKVGKEGADIDVGLRVGGFGSLNTGKAFFRNARLIKINAPPPQATPTFDLAEIRKQALPVPIGRPYSMVLTFIALTLVAIVGWRVFSEDDRVAVAVPSAPKKNPKRAARR